MTSSFCFGDPFVLLIRKIIQIRWFFLVGGRSHGSRLFMTLLPWYFIREGQTLVFKARLQSDDRGSVNVVHFQALVKAVFKSVKSTLIVSLLGHNIEQTAVGDPLSPARHLRVFQELDQPRGHSEAAA